MGNVAANQIFPVEVFLDVRNSPLWPAYGKFKINTSFNEPFHIRCPDPNPSLIRDWDWFIGMVVLRLIKRDSDPRWYLWDIGITKSSRLMSLMVDQNTSIPEWSNSTTSQATGYNQTSSHSCPQGTAYCGIRCAWDVATGAVWALRLAYRPILESLDTNMNNYTWTDDIIPQDPNDTSNYEAFWNIIDNGNNGNVSVDNLIFGNKILQTGLMSIVIPDGGFLSQVEFGCTLNSTHVIPNYLALFGMVIKTPFLGDYSVYSDYINTSWIGAPYLVKGFKFKKALNYCLNGFDNAGRPAILDKDQAKNQCVRAFYTSDGSGNVISTGSQYYLKNYYNYLLKRYCEMYGNKPKECWCMAPDVSPYNNINIPIGIEYFMHGKMAASGLGTNNDSATTCYSPTCVVQKGTDARDFLITTDLMNPTCTDASGINICAVETFVLNSPGFTTNIKENVSQYCGVSVTQIESVPESTKTFNKIKDWISTKTGQDILIIVVGLLVIVCLFWGFGHSISDETVKEIYEVDTDFYVSRNKEKKNKKRELVNL